MSGNRSSVIENALIEKLLKGDAGELEWALSDFILNYVSYFDASTEGFYHGMMLGILVCIFDTHKVKSNKESGYGRFDIALYPKRPDGVGVILEFKSSSSENDLEKDAREALKQIDDKKYETELRQANVNMIYKYGISFCGKMIRVE